MGVGTLMSCLVVDSIRLGIFRVDFMEFSSGQHWDWMFSQTVLSDDEFTYEKYNNKHTKSKNKKKLMSMLQPMIKCLKKCSKLK